MKPDWLESLSLLDEKQQSAVLEKLTPEEMDTLDRELLKRDPRIWVPQPGVQCQAYYSEADELFYGGAQGGGKSDLLLGVAATQHHQSIIFRRTFPLHRALIERSREIFNPLRIEHSKDFYNESLHRWMFPGGGLLEFGAIEHEKDKENYRGRPHDLYGFDEVSQFSESQYRFVIGWLRSTRPGQRCRVIATGNPPATSEGEWVIRYWAPWIDDQHPNPAKEGELRWFTRINDEDVEVPNGDPVKIEERGKTEWVKPVSRTFIRALLSDNPILAKTGYIAKIQALPEPLRSQALYGDFSIGRTDDAWQVIPSAWVKLAMKRWKPDGGDGLPLDVLGVDVARGGKNKTVISPRRGNWFGELIKIPGWQTPDGPTAAGYVAKALREMNATKGCAINIDVIGFGASAYDTLKETEWIVQTCHINPVWSGKAVSFRDKSGRLPMVNVRAACWWKLREALDPEHGENLALPPDNELLADLCAPHYELKTNGIQIEKKEDMMERIGGMRSPDCGDAVVYAHWFRSGFSSVPDPALFDSVQPDHEPATPKTGYEAGDDEEEEALSNFQRRMSRRGRAFFGR